MQRRQCVALCFIFLMAGAEAARSVESANVMNALVLHEGDQIFDRKSFMSHMENMNSTAKKVAKGNFPFGQKYCMLTCPHLWVQMIYHQWRAKSAAHDLVAESFGAGDSLDKFVTVNQPLAETFYGTMRQSVWTFLRVVDTSFIQRVILGLFFAPLGLFRKATKMQPLGLCFLKSAWKDLEASQDYKQKSTGFWNFFLAGCPDQPTTSFEDAEATNKLVGSMVYALSKPEGLNMEEQEAKWRSAPTHVQCVKKLGRNGVWSKRRIFIEKGVLTWSADPKCDPNFLDKIGYSFGREKVISLEFLTKQPGQEAVQFVNDGCIAFQNPYRKFELCAEEGATMDQAKEILEKHLAIMGEEQKLLQMAAKVDRLIAEGLKDQDHDQEEAAEVKALASDMDPSGDQNVEGLDEEIGLIADVDAPTPEVEAAKAIKDKVKKASSLLAEGDLTGSALLQEAYAAAHRRDDLLHLMHDSNQYQEMGGEAAAAGGSISTTEIIIIIIICGGGLLCLGVGFAIASSNLQTGSEFSKVQPFANFTAPMA